MKAQKGFTMIEMLVTIAIVGILAKIAIPSFQSMIITNRLATQTNDLIADLSLARSEAAKSGGRVTVCISSDGSTCTGGTNWSAGRIVFTDSGTYGSVDGTGATADKILRVSPALAGNNTLVSASFTNASWVQYSGTGVSDSSGTFTLCHSGYPNNVVTVSNTGRVYYDSANITTCP
jgi:type IV fimbrial biogenesis protein FimT